ncbi:MAG: hypothetical protein ACRCVI_02805 [Mycoplasmoidaceae bacterium]
MKNLLNPSLHAAPTCDYLQIIKKIFKAGGRNLHIDLMDQSVTPGIGINPLIIKEIPEEVIVDIHIMSSDPLKMIASIPFRKNTYIHTHWWMANDYQNIIDAIKVKAMKVGMTIDLSTDLKLIKPWLKQIELFNFMAIEKIGMSNQTFNPKVLEQYHLFKKLYPDHKSFLAIDGSVRNEHLELIKDKFNFIVVGSLLYNAQDWNKLLKNPF